MVFVIWWIIQRVSSKGRSAGLIRIFTVKNQKLHNGFAVSWFTLSNDSESILISFSYMTILSGYYFGKHNFDFEDRTVIKWLCTQRLIFLTADWLFRIHVAFNRPFANSPMNHHSVTSQGGRESWSSSDAGKATWFIMAKHMFKACVHHRDHWVPKPCICGFT